MPQSFWLKRLLSKNSGIFIDFSLFFVFFSFVLLMFQFLEDCSDSEIDYTAENEK